MTHILYKSAELDVYANWLSESQGPDDEKVKVRGKWVETLPLKEKTETLFTLDTLLKSLLCLGNPRNMPVGGLEQSSTGMWHAESFPPNHNFKAHTQILRDVMLQSVVMIRKLLGSRDRTYTFTRYLQNVLIQDIDRAKVIKEQLDQVSPEESLALLRYAFGSYQDLAEVIVQSPEVNHKTFSALHITIAREIERNTFFCPHINLSFRPEFSRIESTELLQAIRSVPFSSLHRTVMLALLSLFHVQKLLRQLESFVSDKSPASLSYAVWAVVHSDLFSLSHFFRSSVRSYVGDQIEKELLEVPAEIVASEYTSIDAAVLFAQQMTTVLAASGHIIDLELIYIFNHILTHYGAGMRDPTFAEQSKQAIVRMRACVQSQIQWVTATLFQSVGSAAPASLLSSADQAVDAERSAVLGWMFRYILEAFILKLRSLGDHADQWGQARLSFMKEFARHMRTLGYPVLQRVGYPKLPSLLAWVPVLLNTETIDAKRAHALLQQCEHAFGHLAKAQSELRIDDPKQKAQMRDLFEYYLATEAVA